MPRTLINRNMPGDGPSKLAIGFLDCWPANQPDQETPFLSRSIFQGFSAAEIFQAVPELISVPLAGVT
jgi:hypothetical protein